MKNKDYYVSIFHKGFNVALLLILLISLSIIILPINPEFLRSGLDPSWKAVIDYASHNLDFGKDLIFTFGPLGSFWFSKYYYYPNTYVISIFMSLILVLTLFVGLLITSIKLDFYQKFLVYFAIISAFLLEGTFVWFFVPILFVANYFSDYNKYKIRDIVSYMLLVFLSFSILVKFSHFPTAFLTIFFIDIYNYIKHKKISYYTVGLFVNVILLFVFSGQDLSSFIPYFVGSFQTLSGYSESMQVSGPKFMIYIFLILVISMGIIIIKYLFKYKKIEDIMFIVVSSLILFLGLKNGFVRHDGHAIGAFSSLIFTLAMIFLYFANNLKKDSTKYAIVSLILISSITSSFIVASNYYTKGDIRVLLSNYQDNLKQKILFLPKSLSYQRIKEFDNQYFTSIERVKNEFPINDIKGTIDIYPWDQAYLLANGLDYRPRPLFQSYSVYTPYLIEKNKVFLYSARSPENILFSIKEIDGRAPFMMEGATWLDLMKLYDVVDMKGEFLVFKKTKLEKSFRITEISKKKVSFGESLEVPKEDIVYAKIDMKKSFFGRIVNTLFKSPILYLEVTLENGATEKYRIVPGIASSGFILSPNILNITDFFSFSIGKMDNKKVKSLKVINESGCCYLNDIEIKFSKVDTIGFIQSYKISDTLQNLSFYQSIINLNESLDNRFFSFETYKHNYILFSHVGTKYKVNGDILRSVLKNDKLYFGYAIKEEAYSGNNNSEGACFNIYKENNLIYSKCIDPKNNKYDRELQQKSIVIDDLNRNYFFEVVPIQGKSSSYGWSYWSFNIQERISASK